MSKLLCSGVALVGVLLAASGSLATAKTGAQTGATRDARVYGVARACAHHCYLLTGRVVAWSDPSGKIVARRRLVRGQLSFWLRPGLYTLVLDRVGWRVRARAHRSTRANLLVCSVGLGPCPGMPSGKHSIADRS
jgi:hypothetical protein